MKMRGLLLALGLAISLLCSCNRGEMGFSYIDESTQGKVIIFYAPGASNLAYYIGKNVKSMCSGLLPYGESHKALLLFTHLDDGESYLRRISNDEYGNVVSDTLHTIGAGRSASDPAVITEVLQAVREEYPEDRNSYTLILSSHGTGWLPPGAIVKGDDSFYWNAPRHKTFGIEKIGDTTYELEIPELVDAIPMKLDCLIFDACLMGGIEVAYQFRNKVVKLCCSPAEVPGNGYIYSNLADDLLSDAASPESFSEAFYRHYKTALETGIPGEDSYYGVTSTTVDCSQLDQLAQVCSELFEKYRSAIAAVDADKVQHFYRVDGSVNYYRDFYDLQDILVQAGISDQDNAALQDALDGCITFKGATRSFMKNYGGFDINAYCGLSMYLPSKGDSELDAYYKTLDWNSATKLVK